MENIYRDYLTLRGNYDGFFEEEGSFVLYVLDTNYLRIVEAYTDPSKRRNGSAFRLADKCTELAKSKGLKYLTCRTTITGNEDNLSMLAILNYGFIPHSANDDRIEYVKEII